MNTLMWRHPFTGRDLKTLETLPNLQVVLPASKELACGDVGGGALADVEVIVAAVVKCKPAVSATV
jgi:phosphopantothenoylcysteine decarboxylase